MFSPPPQSYLSAVPSVVLVDLPHYKPFGSLCLQISSFFTNIKFAVTFQSFPFLSRSWKPKPVTFIDHWDRSYQSQYSTVTSLLYPTPPSLCPKLLRMFFKRMVLSFRPISMSLYRQSSLKPQEINFYSFLLGILVSLGKTRSRPSITDENEWVKFPLVNSRSLSLSDDLPSLTRRRFWSGVLRMRSLP